MNVKSDSAYNPHFIHFELSRGCQEKDTVVLYFPRDPADWFSRATLLPAHRSLWTNDSQHVEVVTGYSKVLTEKFNRVTRHRTILLRVSISDENRIHSFWKSDIHRLCIKLKLEQSKVPDGFIFFFF